MKIPGTARTRSHRTRQWIGLLTAIAPLLGATTTVVRATAQQAEPGGPSSPLRPTSLAQAVRIAEQQTGGRARQAELERERGVDVYEIKTVARDTSGKVVVDAASGKVVRLDTPGVFSAIGQMFDRDDRRKDQVAFARLEGTAMTLVGAIDAAEKDSGGRAVKASLRTLYGSTLFEVRVVKDLTLKTLVVDPATARVVAAPFDKKHKDDDD